MRKVQLQSGKWVRVGCRHNTISSNDVSFNVLSHMPFGINNVRATEAYIKEGECNPNPGQPEKPLLEVTAYCSPSDNFCRREGRKVAATKLLEKMRESDSLVVCYGGLMNLKEDRKNVFLALCPEHIKIQKGKKDGKEV